MGKNKKDEELSEEMMEETMDIFDALPDDIQEDLMDAFEKSDSKDEFLRLMNVGDCPVCGSEKTRDCEETFLDDNCVGLCLECLTMWCLECGIDSGSR